MGWRVGFGKTELTLQANDGGWCLGAESRFDSIAPSRRLEESPKIYK